MTVSITRFRHNAECHYDECRVLFIVMLNVIMLSVVTLCVVVLSVVMLSVLAPNEEDRNRIGTLTPGRRCLWRGRAVERGSLRIRTCRQGKAHRAGERRRRPDQRPKEDPLQRDLCRSDYPISDRERSIRAQCYKTLSVNTNVCNKLDRLPWQAFPV